MKSAIALAYDYSTPFERCAALAAEAGFRVVSLGMKVSYSGYDTAEGRRRIAEVLKENGLELDNVHDGNGNLASPDESVRNKAVEDGIVALEAAAELGASSVVFHVSGATPEKLDLSKEGALRSVEALLERARKLGVRVAVENSWREEYMAVFRHVLAEFDNPHIAVCYDTSHDQLYGHGDMEVLEDYGRRLAVLHVSDNYGKNDDHLLPWDGIIDWGKFTSILRGTKFPGPMLLECGARGPQLEDLEGFVGEAFSRAERLVRMVEEGTWTKGERSR